MHDSWLVFFIMLLVVIGWLVAGFAVAHVFGRIARFGRGEE